MPPVHLSPTLTLATAGPLRGRVRLPGDKSIAHRLLMLTPLAAGDSIIRNLPGGADVAATRAVMSTLGAEFLDMPDGSVRVRGRGSLNLDPPAGDLDCRSSGTTMRLMCGLLAGQSFPSRLAGSAQLSRRPMDRVVEPLRQMGAKIVCESEGRYPPIRLEPVDDPLEGLTYDLPVASAQVKSAVLLAGLGAVGTTTLHEPAFVRNHTEHLLRAMGADIVSFGSRITLQPLGAPLRALDCTIPGDLSSAAFLIVAALLSEGSEIYLEDVGLNRSRVGLLEALSRMGAIFGLTSSSTIHGEEVGTLRVDAGSLRGAEFGGDDIVTMIDELPILALAATQATGETIISDAAELRVKETDRIASTVRLLRAFGASIDELPDGFRIKGPTPLTGTTVDSGGDHRIALTAAVAGLIASGKTTIIGWDCIADSFPEIPELLTALGVHPC